MKTLQTTNQTKTCTHKKMKLLLILTVIAMCLSLTACGGFGDKIDLAPYLSVTYSGSNGSGTANVDFDFADFEYAVMSQWDGENVLEKLSELTAVEMSMTYAADVSEGLRNGDTITVKISLDEAKAKKYGFAFTGLEKKFKVEGLTEAIEIDPFGEDIFGSGKLVNVTLEGIDPFACLYLRNTATLNDPIRHITYKADKDWNLKNGDVITITATMNQKAAKQGYVLTRSEITIAVEGFDRYASAASDLTKDVLRDISERAYQECVNGGSVDIYDGRSNLTPWGASFENIHVADTALLAVNRQVDMPYSFLLVPVYKTITTSNWYDMDAGMSAPRTWQNVIGYYKFADVIVHADGSVTFDESYVGMKGNYTDINVANEMYLNKLRSNYDFIEVPMP